MSEKITYLKRDDTDREGNALMSKAGKPYTRMTLKVESKGDRYISGFGNASNKDWSVGDEVDITIVEAEKTDKEGRPYLNFSQPKSVDKIGDDIAIIKKDITTLLLLMRDIKDNTSKKGPYPTREMEGMTDEQPFDDDLGQDTPF